MIYPVRDLLLKTAIKRVLHGRMMVVRQRQLIERLRNLRYATQSAEQTLQELEDSLATFEIHERDLKERLNIRQSEKPTFGRFSAGSRRPPRAFSAMPRWPSASLCRGDPL
jgi:hypothetical protein